MKTKLAIIIAIIGLAGCKPKTTTLTGQVFIVTRGSENVKLGDVEIFLIEKPEVTRFLQKKQLAIESKIRILQQELAAAKDDVKNAQQVETNLSNEDLYAVQSHLRTAISNCDNFPTIEDYFEGFLPETGQKTFSDADGKFSFVYPQGKSFEIFAHTERLVWNQTEKYYWLIDAPSNTESTQFFLSNKNLTSIESG